ncbi:PoNe immunity protein domain-containing protein [Frateuria defendens]|uniref:PoNe immunity protein domain-containing protein n=1 Tax=Frateuria defendens TaxID=2219559 RepID=UPI0009E1B8FF|nr:PoNe immunity protein domain-containing protein [Frateuria defendens]
MRRDQRGSSDYWDGWVKYKEDHIPRMWLVLKEEGGDLNYRPQYAFEIVKNYLEQILRRYSRGDAVVDLPHYFSGLLDAWETAENLGENVWSDDVQYTRHSWSVNLDHYVRCFWLTGLALVMNIPDEQWVRLLTLMGNEGEDALLDKIISSRQVGRRVGDKLCYPKVYRKLLEVTESPVDRRSEMLYDFVDGWFASLKDAGAPSFPRSFRTPYWWVFCDNEKVGMNGAYFGCWCIEAVVVAKVFDIDDRLCLSHPSYPGDLLQDGRSPSYPDSAIPSIAERPVTPSSPQPPKSLFSRFLGKL